MPTMPNGPQQSGGVTAAQRMFGAQAPVYAESKVHIRDDSLDAVQRLTEGAAPYRWAVDVGTGAGFTAFAMAQVSDRAVASDLTRPMLQQARRLGRERGLANLAIIQNAAESLPFADGSLDLVTCRVAGHHFRAYKSALDEARRVLKTGGSLVMADSVSPEDAAIARWMNDVELRRDFSHVKNRTISAIGGMLADRGMTTTGSETARIYLWFNAWVERTNVPASEVAVLRRDFLEAAADVKDAFQIHSPQDDGDLLFSWPCWIFRAVKT